MTIRTLRWGVLTLAVAAAIAPAWAGGLRPDGFVHGDPTAVEYAQVAPDAGLVEYAAHTRVLAGGYLLHDVTADGNTFETGRVPAGNIMGNVVTGDATAIEYGL